MFSSLSRRFQDHSFSCMSMYKVSLLQCQSNTTDVKTITFRRCDTWHHFGKAGVVYAGPLQIEYGKVHIPVIVKA